MRERGTPLLPALGRRTMQHDGRSSGSDSVVHLPCENASPFSSLSLFLSPKWRGWALIGLDGSKRDGASGYEALIFLLRLPLGPRTQLNTRLYTGIYYNNNVVVRAARSGNIRAAFDASAVKERGIEDDLPDGAKM